MEYEQDANAVSFVSGFILGAVLGAGIALEHLDLASGLCRLCLDVSVSGSTANESLVTEADVINSCLLVIVSLLLPFRRLLSNARATAGLR